jgi:hypothetical protein
MEMQKKNPFRVPGDYFDTLPGRLTGRIAGMESDQVHARRPGSLRTGLAVAAAITALALLTFPLVRMLSPEGEADDNFIEIALLDGAGLFASDYELAGFLEETEAPLDDEDAYLNQAMEYLASADVEMDLIYEK